MSDAGRLTGRDDRAQAATSDACAATVAALPLRARLALTLMVGGDGDAPATVVALLDSPTRPGGLFVRGGKAVWDDRVLVTTRGDDLPLLVALDDEGGRVQPMEGVLDDLASAAELATESPEALTALAADRGADLLLLSQPADVEAVLDRLEEAVNLGRVPDRRLEAALARVVEVGCAA